MAFYTFKWSTADADGASVVVRNVAGDVVSSGSIPDEVSTTNEAFVSYSVDLPVGDTYIATATLPDGRERPAPGVLDHTSPAALAATIGAGIAAEVPDDERSRRAACLRPFWAGLANRTYSPVNILLIGDSLTEGRGATTGQDSRIWANRLLAALRAKYQPAGVTGGEGYIASWYASPTRTQRWTLTGSPTQHANYGFGRRGVRLNGAAQSMSLTFTGTRLDVFWYGDTTTGSFSWAVDGGSATTVNTVKASPVDGNRTLIAGLSAGSHTVVLTWVSGTVQIDGGFVMNGDESAGIRMIEGGHSGYKSGDYVDAAFPRWIDNVATTNPRLIVINLGTNDAAAAVPVATFKANLQQLITNLRSKFATLAGVSIVLTGSNPRGDMSVASWTPYYDAIKEVVAADPKLLFHDLQARFGTAEIAANTWGLMNADLVHHSDAGQQLYADSLLELIAP